jgi:hypothetical protein
MPGDFGVFAALASSEKDMREQLPHAFAARFSC